VRPLAAPALPVAVSGHARAASPPRSLGKAEYTCGRVRGGVACRKPWLHDGVCSGEENLPMLRACRRVASAAADAPSLGESTPHPPRKRRRREGQPAEATFTAATAPPAHTAGEEMDFSTSAADGELSDESALARSSSEPDTVDKVDMPTAIAKPPPSSRAIASSLLRAADVVAEEEAGDTAGNAEPGHECSAELDLRHAAVPRYKTTTAQRLPASSGNESNEGFAQPYVFWKGPTHSARDLLGGVSDDSAELSFQTAYGFALETSERLRTPLGA